MKQQSHGVYSDQIIASTWKEKQYLVQILIYTKYCLLFLTLFKKPLWTVAKFFLELTLFANDSLM